MVSGVGDATPRPVQGFDRLEEEYRILAENQASGLPYQEGASLTPSDLKTMAIAFDSKAHCDFWKAADRNTRCVLRDSSLKECSGDVQTLLNDTVTYKDSLAEGRPPTIADAYGSSFEYVAAIGYVFEEGLFQNEALLDASGNYLFQRLGWVLVSPLLLVTVKLTWAQSICYIRSDIEMETRESFSTPGYPHVTIVSIQPQRARSQTELLCTEAWTLYYCLYKLARRARRTANQCLPVSLSCSSPNPKSMDD